MVSEIIYPINSINDILPDPYKEYIVLGMFIILISIYSIFVWKFYRFLAKRDLLSLNLAQYNKSEHVFLKKFLAIWFFMAEYIIILPVVVFFWFSIMAVILLLMAREHNVLSILLISATLVGSVRIAAYYNEELSKDLAKLFPFTILVVALLTPNFFDINSLINKISEIPNLFENIAFYLIVIMILEFVLRVLFLVMSSSDEEED